MAVQEIQGKDSLFEISTDGTTYKVLVCEVDNSLKGTADTTKEKTKCGPITGINTPDYTISGNAVTNSTPGASEVSYKDVQGWFNANTKLYFRLQSPAVGELNPGEAYYHAGQGYFNSLGLASTSGETVKFDWEFTVTGELTIDAPEEA